MLLAPADPLDTFKVLSHQLYPYAVRNAVGRRPRPDLTYSEATQKPDCS